MIINNLKHPAIKIPVDGNVERVNHQLISGDIILYRGVKFTLHEQGYKGYQYFTAEIYNQEEFKNTKMRIPKSLNFVEVKHESSREVHKEI